MSLCLAESLIECSGHNPVDQARRYLRWYREGHLSSNGEWSTPARYLPLHSIDLISSFDIGSTTSRSLHLFEKADAKGDVKEGNESPMWLLPWTQLSCRAIFWLDRGQISRKRSDSSKV